MHFQSLFGRIKRDVFLENEGKIHEGGYVTELFRKLEDYHIATSLRINISTDSF